MSISVLWIRIARMNENNFLWFCRHLIRKSIEFHFFARFRYNFNENVFFKYANIFAKREKVNFRWFVRFVWVANFYCNIKAKIWICNNFRNNDFIEKFTFFIFYIENCIKIDKKYFNSMFCCFVEINIFSNVRIKTLKNFYSKNCHQFVFSISCIQINMQSRKKINNQKCDDFVCFAKIANFCSKKYENNFANRFVEIFEFFDYDIRNHVRVCEKYIKFDYRNRKNCKNFRKIDCKYSNSNCSHSR